MGCSTLTSQGVLVPHRSDPQLTKGMAALYRWTSVLWIITASSLGTYAYGTSLLAHAPQLRLIVPMLALLVAVVMLVRVFVPYRPSWTRWTLPLMGAVSVCTFLLSLFGAEGLGLTAARVGVVGLTLVPALFAYTHWVGESLVGPGKGTAQ